MDALLAALASSFLTVIGTGLLAVRRAARRGQAEADARLHNALVEFGSALDALIMELRQLPIPRRRALAAWGWVERHLGGIDFLFGRLARFLFGGELYAALDRLQRSTNELILIAPPELLEALEPIFARFATFGERGEDWFERLGEERAAFAAASRALRMGEADGVAPSGGEQVA